MGTTHLVSNKEHQTPRNTKEHHIPDVAAAASALTVGKPSKSMLCQTRSIDGAGFVALRAPMLIAILSTILPLGFPNFVKRWG